MGYFRTAMLLAAMTALFMGIGYLVGGQTGMIVAFLVAAMFHPIAYQFYFFSIAGLAVALKNTYRAEMARTRLVALDVPGTPNRSHGVEEQL